MFETDSNTEDISNNSNEENSNNSNEENRDNVKTNEEISENNNEENRNNLNTNSSKNSNEEEINTEITQNQDKHTNKQKKMSALTKEAERAIRTIVWDGKQSSYLIWREKFMANAKRRGYKEVMTGKLKVPRSDKVLDENDDAEAKELKARDMNDLGYVDLILSMSDTEGGGIALSYIKNTKTEDLPDGDLQRAWEALEKKYFSKTARVANALSKKFQDL
jgi:hypothetical protein